MPQKLEIDVEMLRALAFQGFNSAQIAAKMGLKPATVKTRLHRLGVSGAVAKVRQKLETEASGGMVVSIAGDIAEQSRLIRSKLSTELANQIALLEQSPPKRVSELGNTPDGQGRAQVVKTIVEAASTIHGWDSEKAIGLVVIGQIRQADQELDQAKASPVSPVIDVSEVKNS